MILDILQNLYICKHDQNQLAKMSLREKKKFPFKTNEFDLAISFGLYHNFNLLELEIALKEFSRIAKKKYLMVESYRDNKELFNLQCWALTCETFLSPKEWEWLFKKHRYNGDYEFIYFQ